MIHAAARVGMWGPYSDFQRDTVDGTRNVVEAAKAAGVPKFVHVGTEAVLVKVRYFLLLVPWLHGHVQCHAIHLL